MSVRERLLPACIVLAVTLHLAAAVPAAVFAAHRS
jgi:hypothetical protein